MKGFEKMSRLTPDGFTHTDAALHAAASDVVRAVRKKAGGKEISAYLTLTETLGQAGLSVILAYGQDTSYALHLHLGAQTEVREWLDSAARVSVPDVPEALHFVGIVARGVGAGRACDVHLSVQRADMPWIETTAQAVATAVPMPVMAFLWGYRDEGVEGVAVDFVGAGKGAYNVSFTVAGKEFLQSDTEHADCLVPDAHRALALAALLVNRFGASTPIAVGCWANETNGHVVAHPLLPEQTNGEMRVAQ